MAFRLPAMATSPEHECSRPSSRRPEPRSLLAYRPPLGKVVRNGYLRRLPMAPDSPSKPRPAVCVTSNRLPQQSRDLRPRRQDTDLSPYDVVISDFERHAGPHASKASRPSASAISMRSPTTSPKRGRIFWDAWYFGISPRSRSLWACTGIISTIPFSRPSSRPSSNRPRSSRTRSSFTYPSKT